jgi:hypothetical protein
VAKSTPPTIELVPYPATPLEEVYVPQRVSRGVFSKHTSDLRLVAVALVAILLFSLVLSVTYACSQPGKSCAWSGHPVGDAFAAITIAATTLSPYFLTAVFTTVAAAFAGLYQLGKQRFSTVDVFSSEIAARMRILAADNSVERILKGANGRADTTVQGDGARAPNPSQESQFETFHRRSSDLGALSSAVVDHVTAFYSFHMAARDELRELSRVAATGDPARLREAIINVVFMVDLMAFNAIKALDDLVETPEHRLHCRQIAMCVGTHASRYLLENLPPEEHRYAEVRLRAERYTRMIAGLKAELKRRRLVPRGKEFF